MPGGKNPPDLVFHKKYNKIGPQYMKSLHKFKNKHLKSDLIFKSQSLLFSKILKIYQFRYTVSSNFEKKKSII